jgi:signal transduction histidine kinase/HPt (histidine-containing phosphotransfer) domain-containing protein/DNA-binding NarL/FixJ family response regulator
MRMSAMNNRSNRKKFTFINVFSMTALVLLGIIGSFEFIPQRNYFLMAIAWSADLITILLLYLLFRFAKNTFTISFGSPCFIFFIYVIYAVYTGKFFDIFFLVFLIMVVFSSAYFNYAGLALFIFAGNLIACFLFFSGFFSMPESGIRNLQDLAVKWVLALIGAGFHLIITITTTRERERAALGDERFRTLLATTPNMTAILDGLYRVIYISKPLAEFARIKDPEFCAGQPVFDLFGEMDIKMMLGDAFDNPGMYQDTREIIVNGESRHFKIIADRFSGSVEGTFIDITDITSEVHARIEAEAANRTKSNFLASMSHEIRTPMNAITGMAELLLRGNLDNDERGYAGDIKQAGNNLISIINDILDFSKIEAGKLEIIPGKYLLSSLVNDVVSIIRIRLVDRPIRFYTNIDAYFPNGLVGDELRIRQILLNLLSNAAKYTERGCISMSIIVEKQEEERVWLKAVISDTGIGIKPEDQQKLFGDFVQVDTKKNQGIEGTGLGLAITKRLCIAMGGGITLESEYGKGSAFTVIIPQGIDSRDPFAAVEEPEKKKVLVYEGRLNYARSVCWSLENMRVPYVMVTNQDAFAAALFQEEWYFIFSGYGLYSRIKPLMERDESAVPGEKNFPGGKTPPLALMVEWGTETFIPGVRFVALPVQALSIANVLNGKSDRGYMEAAEGGGQTRFIIPETRLLIVDDIATNLKVAEGLIAPYQAVVDTCLSGAEAVELVKHNFYDIVFMDHMMPGMDGVEATALIREWEREQKEQKERAATESSREEIPVIALTANAVSGMKEMFLSKGFSDFLSKPIDMSKLDEILGRWIPKSKLKKSDISMSIKPPAEDVEEMAEGLNIPGVDVQQGIVMTGGTLDGYKQVLALFRKDAVERLPRLVNPPEPDELQVFITHTHALKSALASIGAAEISARAAQLEAAGKGVLAGGAGDMAAIRENLPVFAEQLAALVEEIEKALNSEKEGNHIKPEMKNGEFSGPQPAPDNTLSSSPLQISNLLDELVFALRSQNVPEIDRILEEVNRNIYSSGIKETRFLSESMEQISDSVLMAEYGKAEEQIKELTGRLSEI